MATWVIAAVQQMITGVDVNSGKERGYFTSAAIHRPAPASVRHLGPVTPRQSGLFSVASRQPPLARIFAIDCDQPGEQGEKTGLPQQPNFGDHKRRIPSSPA
jgi:hypothetical protein